MFRDLGGLDWGWVFVGKMYFLGLGVGLYLLRVMLFRWCVNEIFLILNFYKVI